MAWGVFLAVTCLIHENYELQGNATIITQRLVNYSQR